MEEDFGVYTGRWFRENVEPKRLTQTGLVGRSIADVIRPVSVIDVGCGAGVFLRCAVEGGAHDIFGIEGPYVSEIDGWKSTLVIPMDRIALVDLQDIGYAKDYEKDSRFRDTYELAICLEVVEHLPLRAALDVIEYLSGVTSTVVFSGARPGQGGVGHINEQSPDYWESEFRKRGFAEDEDTTEKILGKFRGRIPDVRWYEQLRCFRRGESR